MVHLWLVVATIACSIQTMRAQRLLLSALWLAGVSALVAVLLFVYDSPEVAVIELSVGTGLVIVLFVFAISIVGEAPMPPRSLLLEVFLWTLVVLSSMLLAAFTLPMPAPILARETGDFGTVMWGERGLDMLVQTVLIFSGVVGVLGLLGEARLGAVSERALHAESGSPGPAKREAAATLERAGQQREVVP
jgi:uncharacterized MnhB-related membrane protein